MTGSVYVNAKEKQGRRVKEWKGREGETFYTTRSIDVLIGDKEQNEKQKRKKEMAQAQPSYPGPLDRFLLPAGITRCLFF